MSNFHKQLAYQMYGANTEEELRSKLYGNRSGIEPNEFSALTECLSEFDKPMYGEIGVYFGGTFAKVLHFLNKTKKEYEAYGFDLFELLEKETFGENQTHDLYNKWNILNVAYKEDLRKSLEEMGYTRFSLVMGNSNESVDKSDCKFDVVLIDGNHTYKQAKLDFESVIKKTKSGGYIVFDNSSNEHLPDTRYVEIDGGPWKVCEDLRLDDRVSFIKRVHRCTFFKVK
jgi:hypothetical protein